MAVIAPQKPKVQTFPAAKVLRMLTKELIEVASAEAVFGGVALPSKKSDILNSDIAMDSLSVVQTLCAIEPIVGFEIRESVVRAGGYNSIHDALEHLIPKIERAWVRKKGSKNDKR